MRVLGIESSCDDTAVAIYDTQRGLMAHHIYSQITSHREWGGVVPELASRDHIRKAAPLIQQVLRDAHCGQQDINGIAYTQGPGLIGALMVGASVACALAYAWQLPAIGVHHLEAHLMAVMLEERQPQFPFLALLVSGGHTMLVAVKAFGDYCLLGESLDDAAGEAFDKTAKLLGIGYPGGPALAALAESGRVGRFVFPRPMIHHKTLDFSFSGLKTHVLTVYNKQQDPDQQTKADIAHAFQQAVVDTLLIKCQQALQQTALKQLVVVGGVGANQALRHALSQQLDVEVFYPRPAFCTDNGAMVAYTGWRRLKQGQLQQNLAVEVRPRWPLSQTLNGL